MALLCSTTGSMTVAVSFSCNTLFSLSGCDAMTRSNDATLAWVFACDGYTYEKYELTFVCTAEGDGRQWLRQSPRHGGSTCRVVCAVYRILGRRRLVEFRHVGLRASAHVRCAQLLQDGCEPRTASSHLNVLPV